MFETAWGGDVLLNWILGEILVGAVLGALLGRFASGVGACIVFLGVAPMGALYLYETIAQPTWDSSSAGMLSTIALFVVTPVGVTTLFVGYFKGLMS